MNRVVITVFLLAGTIIQLLLPQWGIFRNTEMPVLNGLLICIALHTDYSRMLFAAVLTGLLHDTFSPAPLGLSIPFFVILAMLVYRIRNDVFGDRPFTYVVLGVASALFQILYYVVVFALSGLRPLSFGLIGLRLSGSLLAGALVVPLVSIVVLRLTSERSRRRFS